MYCSKKATSFNKSRKAVTIASHRLFFEKINCPERQTHPNGRSLLRKPFLLQIFVQVRYICLLHQQKQSQSVRLCIWERLSATMQSAVWQDRKAPHRLALSSYQMSNGSLWLVDLQQWNTHCLLVAILRSNYVQCWPRDLRHMLTDNISNAA